MVLTTNTGLGERWCLTLLVFCLVQGVASFLAPTCPSNVMRASVQGQWRRHRIADRFRASRSYEAPHPPFHAVAFERSTPLQALSTSTATEPSSSEQSLRELIRLLDMKEAQVEVREATGMEGDCVAHLRCSVFGQGKEMYRSQRQKMRTSPHYLLAGIYKTTLMVAVVHALTPRARQVCKDVVLADMQKLLDQAWISPWEHTQLVEQLEYEWEARSDIVIGSVDCSVHEMLDSSLTLRRWVYVSSMAVRCHLRQRGIGEQLLELAVSHARKIFGVKDMFLHVEVSYPAPSASLFPRLVFSRWCHLSRSCLQQPQVP